MIYASDTQLLVKRDDDRLVIRDVDSVWRLFRILFSLPFVIVGLFVLFVVLSGGGMAEARDGWQWFSKFLFLGLIGILLGLLPLTVGLRIWLVREEIAIYSSGELSKSLLLGPFRFAGAIFPDLRCSDFHIRTWRGTKTGTHHEVVVQASPKVSEIRLLSFKSKADAQQWKERIASYLSGSCAATTTGEQVMDVNLP